MKDLIPIVLAAAAAAYACYVTIQGYRTGVLRVRTRIDQRVSPRQYWVMLVLMIVLSSVSLGAVALMIYGETHPEWRRAHAKHAAQMRQQATVSTADRGSNRAERSNEGIAVRH
jgi:hypothetical protein